jgi:hypothetical protein
MACAPGGRGIAAMSRQPDQRGRRQPEKRHSGCESREPSWFPKVLGAPAVDHASTQNCVNANARRAAECTASAECPVRVARKPMSDNLKDLSRGKLLALIGRFGLDFGPCTAQSTAWWARRVCIVFCGLRMWPASWRKCFRPSGRGFLVGLPRRSAMQVPARPGAGDASVASLQSGHAHDSNPSIRERVPGELGIQPVSMPCTAARR